jgi:ankyrin repeat protein
MNKKKETPLIAAILTKKESLIKLILKVPEINVNIYSQQQQSEQENIEEHKKQDEQTKKIKKRFEENYEEFKKMGWSPLHLLVKLMEKIDLIEMICKKGANVNVKNKHSITPLHLAVQQGNLSVVSILIRFSADVNAKAFPNLHNKNGWGDVKKKFSFSKKQN